MVLNVLGGDARMSWLFGRAKDAAPIEHLPRSNIDSNGRSPRRLSERWKGPTIEYRNVSLSRQFQIWGCKDRAEDVHGRYGAET